VAIRLDLADTGPSVLDSAICDPGAPREKMSKSRGNGVTVDAVLYGVAELAGGHEFRDVENRRIVEWQRCGVWRDRHGDGFFYTGSSFGGQPVFLCLCDEIIPSRLLIGGREVLQHPSLVSFWEPFYRAFPEAFDLVDLVRLEVCGDGAD